MWQNYPPKPEQLQSILNWTQKVTALILVNEDYFFSNAKHFCELLFEEWSKRQIICVLYRTPGVLAVSPGINGNSAYRVWEWLLKLVFLVKAFSSILLFL